MYRKAVVVCIIMHLSFVHSMEIVRKGLTTPERYGMRMSTKQFDQICFAPLGEHYPTFSSDHVLCTMDQVVDPDGFTAYVKSVEPYVLVKEALRQGLVDEYGEVTDVTNTIKTLYCAILLDDNILHKEGISYVHNKRMYDFYNKQALANVELCKKAVVKADIDITLKEAALKKLADDFCYLSQNFPMTEQNLIRSFQYCDVSAERVELDSKNRHRASELLRLHKDLDKRLMGNMYLSVLHHMPVAHSSTIPILEGDEPLWPAYGIYYKRRLSDTVATFEKGDEIVCHYFQCDPRYNKTIHGNDFRIVWFEFPHSPNFNAGVEGEGTAWMKLEDAKQKIGTNKLCNSLQAFVIYPQVTAVVTCLGGFFGGLVGMTKQKTLWRSVAFVAGSGSLAALSAFFVTNSTPKKRYQNNFRRRDTIVSCALFCMFGGYNADGVTGGVCKMGGTSLLYNLVATYLYNVKHYYTLHTVK